MVAVLWCAIFLLAAAIVAALILIFQPKKQVVEHVPCISERSEQELRALKEELQDKQKHLRNTEEVEKVRKELAAIEKRLAEFDKKTEPPLEPSQN